MADAVANRAARLKGGKKKSNVPALLGITLVVGLGAGGAGVAHLMGRDGSVTIQQRDTSDASEFPRNSSDGMTSVITPEPAFPVTEAGPSEAEIALQKRLDEVNRLLDAARNEAPAAPVIDTAQLDALRTQLDGLAVDMAARSAEVQDLTIARDQLTRDLQRTQAENSSLLLQLNQASDDSLAEQMMAEERLARQQELERRRAEAESIRQAQINSPIDGMSGGGTESEGRDYTGDEAFIRAGSDKIAPTQSRVIGAPSNTVMQGTVIEATLTTGINSQLSGTITSTVSYDIWSFDMSRVLIPRGSQMFGRYSNEVAVGQKRVLVAWDRVVTPNGQVVDLEAYGSDRLGRSGLTGKVNSRFLQRFGSAALISVFSAAPAAAAASVQNDESAILAEAVSTDASDNASAVIEEYLSLAPIITVEHGSVIMVMVTNDMELF
ncbi:TrbI/VirB10 family protein [Loktanella sp. M215]|uniref:TrbI/VirB10 family protein n=1 Tax=Loktanella sp. M215 TaxID=2675431 RepID=UPI001F17BAA5|nr:TrbI/VirB10 family protein [Loktanella sp. M215]MCF7701524.1 conjugal transfer protein [Loktanella sp. M215]MCF7701943.1 conjugal transfer protein [Loktanella sp. M215]